MSNHDQQQAIARLAAIPRLNFGHYPTPIEELSRFRQLLGANAPRIFIKRDDYTGPGFGGNKVRKLEYLLAQAQADGADVVISCGGVKSNHARVTAAMCARAGLRCVLVLNQAAVMYDGLNPASLIADEMFGAEIIRVANREERIATMAAETERLKNEGRNVAVIPLGGSVPLGALGFVRAVQEAKAQLEAMNVRVDFIFHSSSSGGTQAGIVAGLQLFGLDGVKDIGVSPDDSSESIGSEVSQVIRGVGELLGVELDDQATVLDEYTGDGYGIPSLAGEEALAMLARAEGVVLDPVYTAKAMAALIDWVRKGKLGKDDNVLFWHTGGQLALFYSPDGTTEGKREGEKK
ncbi:MAG: D-cysteine desulfhydrase family protein [Acidobacteria bacterium]|nr:D-cysteine desulfhydrase family protein [Acidobacteriota bacterium]